MKYPLKRTIVTAVILACKSLYGSCPAGPADENNNDLDLKAL
jgi:hypothetical protein